MNIDQAATLLDVFPDATLAHTHRDPKVVMASYAALLEVTWLTSMEKVALPALGEFICAFWQQQVARNLEDRKTLGEKHILDAYYDDICDRAEDVIAGIYAAADRELTPRALAAFRDYEQRRPAGYFGKHHYSLERYRLDEAKIEAMFGDYYACFPQLAERCLLRD